ncbi:MAG: family 20 glycosylhydrolase [Bacteroidaceae bacterium]|nr:family 20 glycosylhydrolase [Bacteroidaceae bacterium]
MMRRTLLLVALAIMAGGLAVAQVPFTVPQIQSWKASDGVFDSEGREIVVVAKNMVLEDAAGYLRYSMRLMRGVKDEKGAARIVLKLQDMGRAGNEAYRISIKPSCITVSGGTPQAVMWGIQTLLQMREQDRKLPCGNIQDRPDYRLRGFMIDVARKFVPMDYLKNLVRTMSYYKMNCLQVHLNDNGFKKYFHDNWDETYSAFRLESERFPELTARDGHYSKEEFRAFVRESAKLGVEIIPEIDVPAHSLAFTHFRRGLGCEEFGVDHLDLTNPEVVPFIDSLFTEYLQGPEPVFCGPRVHIGTDEYSNKRQEVVELFRGLTDHLIRLVESYGRQAVVWGSLTYAKGSTPVKSKNVLMGVWNNGFANPKDMKEAGYQLVSIPDGLVYIVPAAGYYYDYLNDRYLYERWTPALIGDVRFMEKDPQIEGGMFAVWNDVCGNGISVGDIHHRTFPALQVIAQKCWHAVNDTVGYEKWNVARKAIGEGPGMNELGRTEMSLPALSPATVLGNRSIPALSPATVLGNRQGLRQIGYDYQIDFDITWAQERHGAVLTKSRRAKFYLADPIRGMLGFSRDGYLFTFKYSGRPGRTEHITIKGTNRYTQLLVNGKVVETLGYDERLAADKKPYNIVRTLVFPLEESGTFRSRITNFSAKKL